MSVQGKEIHNTERVERLLNLIGNAVLVVGTTNATPDTETTHAHTLEDQGAAAIPRGYLIISKDKAGDIYDSDNAHTDALLKLKCAVASVTFTALVF